MSKIGDFLKEAGTFYLATVDGDQPKVRPLGAHMEMDGKVLFGVGDFKDFDLIADTHDLPMVSLNEMPSEEYFLKDGDIVFVRSKRPTLEMIEIAEESGIVILATKKRMYEACGTLFVNGLNNTKE